MFSTNKSVTQAKFSVLFQHSLAWIATLFLVMAAAGPAMAEGGEGPVKVDFSRLVPEPAPGARITIDYSNWDAVLRKLVLGVGPSNRYSPRRSIRSTGTRRNLGNPNPSWLEANRVRFHLLKDGHIDNIGEYRRELEAIPADYPLKQMSRNEQLAYWLNLHNVTVLEQLARVYPRVSLKRFRTRGLWDEKLLNVTGIPLSLNDIQNNIVIAHWDEPMVIYGFYQGAIGGPNIRRRAFNGQTVRAALRDNGQDFVNSIRGVHRKGDVARYSYFYDWVGAAFPGGREQLVEHLFALADEKTIEILEQADRFEAGYFDWYIGDIYNGRPNHASIYANTVTDLSGHVRTMETILPPHVQQFYTGLRVKFGVFGVPRTRIEIEEVPRDPEGNTEPVEAGRGGEPDPDESPDDNRE